MREKVAEASHYRMSSYKDVYTSWHDWNKLGVQYKIRLLGQAITSFRKKMRNSLDRRQGSMQDG